MDLIPSAIFFVRTAAPLVASLHPKNRKMDRPASTAAAPIISRPDAASPLQSTTTAATTHPMLLAASDTSAAQSDRMTDQITMYTESRTANAAAIARIG